MNIRRLAAAALLLVAGNSSLARAQVANGNTGTFTYRIGTTVFFGPSVFTVGSGVELSNTTFAGLTWSLNVDATARTLTIDVNDRGCCTSTAAFNGWEIAFDSDVFAGVDVVTLQSTNVTGFTASRVTNTANVLKVDFANGLDLRSNRQVVLGLPTPAPVPEPSSVVLFAAGAMGLTLRSLGGRRNARRP